MILLQLNEESKYSSFLTIRCPALKQYTHITLSPLPSSLRLALQKRVHTIIRVDILCFKDQMFGNKESKQEWRSKRQHCISICDTTLIHALQAFLYEAFLCFFFFYELFKKWQNRTRMNNYFFRIIKCYIRGKSCSHFCWLQWKSDLTFDVHPMLWAQECKSWNTQSKRILKTAYPTPQINIYQPTQEQLNLNS